MAEWTGLDAATISRWSSNKKRGNHGRVPPQYNLTILDAADHYAAEKWMRDMDSRNKFMVQISVCLDPTICPTCQQVLAPGVTISKARRGSR